MTVVTLRPRLHEFVSGEESRTRRQLEALGVDVAVEPKGSVVSIEVSAEASPVRRLLANATVDYVLRLDPLVSNVRVVGFEDTELAELGERVPLEITVGEDKPVYSIAFGDSPAGADLVADAHGWLAAIGDVLDQPEEAIVNPVGRLAAAALAAGEIFKALFTLNYPDARLTRRFVGAAGTFSCFDYSFDGANPPLEPFAPDAFLVGLGGVGAAVVRALGELGSNVSGPRSLRSCSSSRRLCQREFCLAARGRRSGAVVLCPWIAARGLTRLGALTGRCADLSGRWRWGELRFRRRERVPGVAAVGGAHERGSGVPGREDRPAVLSRDEVGRPYERGLRVRRHRHGAPAATAVGRPEQIRSCAAEEHPAAGARR